MLSIDKDNKIFLGGTQVTWKDLEAKLKANERVQKESALYIEADTDLPYGVVVTAMAVAKNAGVAQGDDAHRSRPITSRTARASSIKTNRADPTSNGSCTHEETARCTSMSAFGAIAAQRRARACRSMWFTETRADTERPAARGHGGDRGLARLQEAGRRRSSRRSRSSRRRPRSSPRASRATRPRRSRTRRTRSRSRSRSRTTDPLGQVPARARRRHRGRHDRRPRRRLRRQRVGLRRR